MRDWKVLKFRNGSTYRVLRRIFEVLSLLEVFLPKGVKKFLRTWLDIFYGVKLFPFQQRFQFRKQVEEFGSFQPHQSAFGILGLCGVSARLTTNSERISRTLDVCSNRQLK